MMDPGVPTIASAMTSVYTLSRRWIRAPQERTVKEDITAGIELHGGDSFDWSEIRERNLNHDRR